MMVSHNGAFGILIGAAIGTLFLVPAHGSAQDSLSASCADLAFLSPLEDLTRCVEQGHAGAQYSLGLKNDAAFGIPEDNAEAARLYRLAAEQGHIEAHYRLGVMYDNGLGVPQDDAEAVRWSRLAAEQGYTVQFNRYRSGNGVPEDDAEAVRWYRLAAEQGHAGAQYNLGLMYVAGEGVPDDDAEGLRWFRLAAEQGDAGAQLQLAAMYVQGEVVLEDLVLAHMWISLSAAQDQEWAQMNKEMLEDTMTREQIAEAQSLSREWIEAHPQDGGN